MSFILGVLYISGLMFAFYYGWAEAHKTVAHECEKLGAFYVGNKVYRCVEVKENE